MLLCYVCSVTNFNNFQSQSRHSMTYQIEWGLKKLKQTEFRNDEPKKLYIFCKYTKSTSKIVFFLNEYRTHKEKHEIDILKANSFA